MITSSYGDTVVEVLSTTVLWLHLPECPVLRQRRRSFASANHAHLLQTSTLLPADSHPPCGRLAAAVASSEIEKSEAGTRTAAGQRYR
jgi:hypothetical protein